MISDELSEPNLLTVLFKIAFGRNVLQTRAKKLKVEIDGNCTEFRPILPSAVVVHIACFSFGHNLQTFGASFMALLRAASKVSTLLINVKIRALTQKRKCAIQSSRNTSFENKRAKHNLVKEIPLPSFPIHLAREFS